MKKKVLLCLLAASVMLALTACSEKASSANENTETARSSQQQTMLQVSDADNKSNEEVPLRDQTENDDPSSLTEEIIPLYTRKLTYNDVKKIIADVIDKIPDDGKYAYIEQGRTIMERIRSIQRIPDWTVDDSNGSYAYLFWPDAINKRDRRSEIYVYINAKEELGYEIIYNIYNDHDECISSETMYDTTARWIKLNPPEKSES